MPGILRFVSMLFLIFEKGDKKKNCARYFETRKYAFLIFEKGDKQNNCARYFEIRKYFFLIFEKEHKQKTVPGILRFVSILF